MNLPVSEVPDLYYCFQYGNMPRSVQCTGLIYLRERWKQLEITVKEGIHELSCLCSTTVQVMGVKYNEIPRPRKRAAELLDALEVKLPPAIPHRNVIVATRKRLARKRKTD